MSSERTITFSERAALTGSGEFRLDKEAGIARGVAICGFTSANGRDYPPSVLARDHAKYESGQVYIDHKQGERNVREWFGQLKNVRLRGDGKPVADLHYPKNSSFTAEFEERAERFPESFGLSHVAVCKTKRVNGRDVIEAIQRVESVDLVARPATNSSLFESQQGGVMDEQEKAALTAKLTESEGRATVAEGQLTSLREQVEKLTAERDNFKAEVDALKQEKAVNTLLSESGLADATPVERKAVAAMPEGDRPALIESFKAARRGKQSQPPVSEGRLPDETGKRPATADEYRSRLKSDD